ncbi:MAG: response regulator [Candidatus Omnitrophica bacterium]|nr:response regulator [Candidatus Omnitrophota bacterium]MDD5437072.1 response regulator [Candidatus Omnitrophota bacterium]
MKNKKKILVVDDEKEFTTLIKANLEVRGKYEVRTENKSSRALDAIREFKPDLVLLDIMMPDGIDGDEIARQVRSDEEIKNTPIIFLTAVLTEEEVAERKGVIGGFSFIAKPVKLQELMEHVEKIVG